MDKFLLIPMLLILYILNGIFYASSIALLSLNFQVIELPRIFRRSSYSCFNDFALEGDANGLLRDILLFIVGFLFYRHLMIGSYTHLVNMGITTVVFPIF